MGTKIAFCAAEQADTEHEITVDANGEIVLTCTSVVDEVACGRFVKFAAGLTVDQIVELMAKHKDANAGQVSIEPSIKVAEALADEKAPE